MRAYQLAVVLMLMPVPALAETIAPCDAAKYVGKSVTVEGLVNEVHHAASGKVTFVDMGARYPTIVSPAYCSQMTIQSFPT